MKKPKLQETIHFRMDQGHVLGEHVTSNHGQVESISVLPAGIRISKKSPRKKAYAELKPGDHIAAGDIILLDVGDPWASLITVTLTCEDLPMRKPMTRKRKR